MRSIITLFVFLFVFLGSFETSAQAIKDVNPKSKKHTFSTNKSKAGSAHKDKAIQNNHNELIKQIRSPFRYLIISNITEKEMEADIPQRRLEVLMDEKAFNEKNLKLLLHLLKKRFPLPIPLQIKVHTSLATIETPEEEDILSDHSELLGEEDYHKTALYIRFYDGAEDFTYDYGRPPNFWRKSIVLSGQK